MRCARAWKNVAVMSMVGLGAALGAARAAGGEGRKVPTTSPTRVLESLDNTGGVSFARGPRDRVEAGDDRTLAPYFYVAGGDPEKDRLPLEKTSAKVNIAGVIAGVTVRQVFENRGGKPIEAVYVFPASTRAAVHAMRMKIGARTIEARIERKQEARARYEEAKRQGKRASLLEQERPNVFSTSVANIMPGDRIEVELNYSELIVPEVREEPSASRAPSREAPGPLAGLPDRTATYEFVYPTVVGPRYAGGADAKKDRWIANPHLGEGQAEPYGWDIEVRLQTGIGIKEISSPSHAIAVSYAGPTTAEVKLDQQGGGNKDFVLRYRLAGDKIETGLLLFEEPASGRGRPGEKFFALLMEPPRRPAEADIPRREYIFLLDVSGSMHGFPLDTAKTLMRELLGNLRPSDHFNVALFSGANHVWSPSGSRQATRANIQAAIDVIQRQSGGGGTELVGGLQAAYAIPPLGPGVARTVVVVTDGYVGVEAQAFRFIRQRLGEANLFAFGIGTSVNRGLIEGMARAGLGEPFVVLRPDRAAAEAAKLRHMIDRPVLTDIQVKVSGVETYEVAPERVPDLLAERPLLLFGKYRGERAGKIEITGRSGRGRFAHSIDLRPADARRENQALRALWARKWVEILEDELHMGGGKPVEDAITDLGLFYTLLTPFTSFVAIDSEVANRTGQVDTVRQALPLPEGVSSYAVGGTAKPMKMAVAPSSALPLAAPMPAARANADDELAAKPGMPRELSRGAGGSGHSEADKPARPQRETKGDGKERAKDGGACIASVSADRAANLGALEPLLDFIARVARAETCAAAPVTLKLRLHVDGSGKIVKVERLAGDRAAARVLAARLTGSTSATRATAAAGTVEITVALAR